MSRISAMFSELANEGRTALVPYVTAGDPEPGITVDLMHAMVASGANMLELGLTFSFPMDDGQIIHAVCERALEHGTTLSDVLAMVKRFREQDDVTPVVLMGYLNPVEVLGYESFAAMASEAGIDGVLTVDMPPEEAAPLAEALGAQGLDPIFLASPTSHEQRLRKISDMARGFIYYVSLKGVTGAASLDVDAVADKLAEIRQLSDLPLGVGFGIRDAPSAAAVAHVADAVVVGSAVVNRLAEHASDKAAIIDSVSGLLRDMREAMDAVDSGV